jgi:hypothetical protein
MYSSLATAALVHLHTCMYTVYFGLLLRGFNTRRFISSISLLLFVAKRGLFSEDLAFCSLQLDCCMTQTENVVMLPRNRNQTRTVPISCISQLFLDQSLAMVSHIRRIRDCKVLPTQTNLLFTFVSIFGPSLWMGRDLAYIVDTLFFIDFVTRNPNDSLFHFHLCSFYNDVR